MKDLLGLLVLAFALAQSPPAMANGETMLETDQGDAVALDEAGRVRDEMAFWKCSAQAPRLIRVYTVRREGYRSDVQAEALQACNDRSVLQCWPLGCTREHTR